MVYPTLHSAHHHCGWDNSLPPAAEVSPGQTVGVELLDASGGRITPDASPKDLLDLQPERANPVTGPLWVAGAAPGDRLVVEVQEVDLAGWGWTGLIPGFGLLAEDFPEPWLHISHFDRSTVEFAPDIHLPTRPFPGTIGVAPAEAGYHAPIPPRTVGGNLDLKDLVPGARLHLPVAVSGALLSVGDPHAAQGDGEVCGTAVECPMAMRLRIELHKGTAPSAPQVEQPAQARPKSAGDVYITTGVGPELMGAAQDAVRAMVEHLDQHYALPPELAYAVCGVAADLRIIEAVNVPHWVVGVQLPLDIFR